MSISLPPRANTPDPRMPRSGLLDGVPGGEMGARITAFDWAATPLGATETWSPALRLMVRFLLPNRIPALLWWGPEYVCIYNDAYIPVLGTKHPDALGRPTHEVWSEIWDILRPLVDTPFQGGPATWNDDIELELNRHGFTEETHFTIAYSPVPDDTTERGIGGVLATVVEITEKVIAERRVTALRDLSGQNVEAAQGGDPSLAAVAAIARHPKDLPFALIYLVDEGATEARLAAATAIDRDRFAPPTAVDLADGADPAWPVAQALRTGSSVAVADGGDGTGLGPAVFLPIPSANPDQPAGVLVAGVSPRLRLDEQYRTFLDLAAAQIGTAVANARAYEAERRRAEALAELDRAKTAFFSNVSHEFRTPLTMMLGPIRDLLEDDKQPLTGPQRERLALADRSSRRLLRLVNALLEFSRIEAGRVDASFEETDLGALTSDLASQFRSAVERAGLELAVDVQPIDEPVFVDREMWEKVVLNLLSNALKSTFDGRIEVRVRTEPGAVLLEVQDTGIGIAAEELPKVFERFHRVEQAQARTHEGSGIGLSLVQELVRLHGGEITVASTVGEGSTFTVRLPTGAAHLPPDRIAATRSLSSTATGVEPFVEEALAWLPEVDVDGRADDGPAGDASADAASLADAASDAHLGAMDGSLPRGPHRILVVDDNADMRRYLGRLLGRHWNVEVVRDGEAAQEALAKRPFDLVLSDVMMPKVDGLELLTRIRADPETRDIPVLLLSARAGEDSRIEGAAAGADDYIVKPFSSRELVARVGAALRLAVVRREAREALRASNEQLQTALAVKDEFLGLVSHELRTPLTVILGMSKVLERVGASDLRARELAADVAESADVLNGLVESMLLLARLDRDEAAMLREPVLLHHAASRILEERRRRDPSRPYDIRIDDVGALVSVQPTWLERVIDNFVGNAGKYSTPGTQVQVIVDTIGDEARLRVVDQGPGLEPEELARVFEPFYRSPRARERAGGAGLGLAVAKRIVELMGGRIWAERTDAGGSEFGFALPLVTDIEP